MKRATSWGQNLEELSADSAQIHEFDHALENCRRVRGFTSMVIYMSVVGVVLAVAFWRATYEVGQRCYDLAAQRGWASTWCMISATAAGFATLLTGIVIGGYLALQ